jgi:hypothetical protein
LPVEYSSRFRREFQKKTPKMQAAILKTLKRLDDGDPSPGLRKKKMRGHDGVYEASVDMATRVTFEQSGNTIRMRANCNHDILQRP